LSSIIGISAGSHDSAVSVINNGKLVYAGHSERYSGLKNDPNLNYNIISDALLHCDEDIKIYFYEKPLLKKSRQLYDGQYYEAFFDKPISDIKKILDEFDLGDIKIKTISHHLSHASTSFISPYQKSIVLVIDAIGEWDTLSIWLFDNKQKNKLKKLYSRKYPNSLGLFYSAFTQYTNLIPNKEEHIFMSNSAFGTPEFKYHIKKLLFNNNKLKYNLHKGLPKKIIENLDNFKKNIDKYKYSMCIANSVQTILEEQLQNILDIVEKYQLKYNTDNLVYSGGIALNCVANSMIQKRMKNLYIYPNPGDAGSSLGCALYGYYDKVPFETMYLGHNINSDYPVDELYNELITTGIVGVVNGKAEFGPRALGNRSLLADPNRKLIIKTVNDIKQRECFRPYGAVIPEELFNKYFYAKVNSSPYMQYVYKCKDFKKFKSILNIDHTCRVQTINEKQNKGLYELLIKFYKTTGCPMLLNTSLNIKGKPIVNSKQDGENFGKKYNIKVF